MGLRVEKFVTEAMLQSSVKLNMERRNSIVVDTVIKDAKVATTEGIFRSSIAIDHEKIVAVGNAENLPSAKRVIDAKGNFVIPGMVDSHTHFLAPPTNDWAGILESETKACAAGGITTAVHCIMEHKGKGIIRNLRKFQRVFEASGYIDVACTAAIYSLEDIAEMERAIECGIPAFKFFLAYRGRDVAFGFPPSDDGIIYLGFDQIGKLVKAGYKTFARVHAETTEIAWKLEDKFYGQGKEPKTYTEIRPYFLEMEAIHKCIIWSKVTGCPLFIVHLSTKEGADIVSKAKIDGVDIVAETCPQYLVLNTKNTDKLLSKINPPIRYIEDNKALWQAINGGTIAFVGTDHVATRKEEKKDFWRAMGIPGLETWLPLMLSEGVNKGRITMEKLVEICCYNTAKKFGLIPRKGVIGIGSDADLVIIDLNKKAKVNANNFYSRADYSCYDGWELKGWPILTMVRGNIIMEDGKVLNRSNLGRYVPAKIQ